MKKIFVWVCMLTILFALSGCSANDATDADATSAPDTQALDAFVMQPDTQPETVLTPTPEPARTPVPDYSASEYTYNSVSIQELGLSLTYPSFYEVAYTQSTVTFTQPVVEGATPVRFAVTVKDYEGKTLNDAKAEVRSFQSVLKNRYEYFKAGKMSNSLLFMNRSALSFTYKAMQGDAKITGMVIMTGVDANKKIYAFHMSAPTEKYNKLQRVFKKVMYSCAPIY